jgi:hypothetical protein
MGYHDEKIRLHDTALVELLPMNDVLQLEIIKLSVDLLDPTATRPTIGAYIPNIVYIQRQTAREASGGVSGKLSGRVGSSQTNTEAEWSEFIAGIDANNMLISLHAAQVDHDNNVLKAAGLDIDANGAIIYATDNVNMIGSRLNVTAGKIDQEIIDRSNADTTLQSNITQEANRISLIVQNVGADGTVTAASIVSAVNDGGSSVVISADHVDLQAYVTATYLDTRMLNADALFSNTGYIGTIRASGMHAGGNIVADGSVIGAGVYFGTSAPYTNVANAISGIGTYSASGGQITIPTTRLNGTAGPNINFNIADTQFYKDGVAAAILEGESHFTLASVTLQGTPHTVTPISGGGWYCHAGSTYTVQGSLIKIALYDADGVRYNTNGVNVYKEGTSTVQAASGSFYRYSAGNQLTLYDGGQTYTNTYYTYTG